MKYVNKWVSIKYVSIWLFLTRSRNGCEQLQDDGMDHQHGVTVEAGA